MRLRYNLFCAKLLVVGVPFMNHNQEDGEIFFFPNSFSLWAREAIEIKGSEEAIIGLNLFQVSKHFTQEDVAIKT